MTAKWHEVGGATIDKDGPQEAARLALRAWRRQHSEKPDAVFMRVPFAPMWNGLPVIADSEISASIVYVGVTR